MNRPSMPGATGVIAPLPPLRSLPQLPRAASAAPDRSVARLISLLVLVFLLPIAFLGPSVGLGVYAVAVLLVGVNLLWRPGEPPILLLIFGFQWVQAAIVIFAGNLAGLVPEDYVEHDGAHVQAVFLSLTGALALGVGMRLAAGRARGDLAARVQAMIAVYPLSRWFALWLGTFIFSQLAWMASLGAGGLSQPLLFLANVRWAPFLLLTMASFSGKKASPRFFLIAFMVEFVLSLGGFFSDFKDVFFYTLIGLSAGTVKIRLRTLVPILIAGLAMIALGVVWSSIKRDYRTFINGGSGLQINTVTYGEQLAKLGELVGNLGPDKLQAGQQAFVQRLMYYEFMGVVLERVPAAVPHTGGALWGEAIIAPFTPRLLFPDKRVYDDTALTIEYTGIRLAQWGAGVSISMGYMAEAYIDFGPVLMFAAIGVLGLAMGSIYRWLMGQPGTAAVFGLALAPVVLMPARFLESSSFKVFAPLVLGVMGSWLILRVVTPAFVSAIAREQRKARTLRAAVARRG